jgi:anti-sigma factor RsiW
MKINKNDPRLTAFVLNELSSAERSVIEQAIQADPELKREVLLLQTTVGLLSQSQESEVFRLDPAQREKLFPKKKSLWTVWTLSGGLATACLALILFQRTNYQQTESAAPREVVVQAPAAAPAPAKVAEKDMKPMKEAQNQLADIVEDEGARAGAGSGLGSAGAAAPSALSEAPAHQMEKGKSTADTLTASRSAEAKKAVVVDAEVVSDENQELVDRLQRCFAENSKHSVQVSFKVKQQMAVDLQMEGAGLNSAVKTCITTLINKQKWFKATQLEYKLRINSK